MSWSWEGDHGFCEDKFVPFKRRVRRIFRDVIYGSQKRFFFYFIFPNFFQEMEGLKLDDVDTSDVQLDDEDLLED